MPLDLRAFRADRRHLGFRRAALRAAYYRASHWTGWRAYRLIRFPRLSDWTVRDSEAHGFQCRLVSADVLQRFADTPGYRLPGPFLSEAAEKKDWCLAVFDGDDLASFGWYSNRPTAVEDGMTIHFDGLRVYMYHGYTRPEFRGRHLHGIGLARAFSELRMLGFQGIVTLAEWVNFASLTSAYRTGYVPFGSALFRNRGGRIDLRASPGCGRNGVTLEPVGRVLYRESP